MITISILIIFWCALCQFLATRKGNEETRLWGNWLATHEDFSAAHYKRAYIFFNRFNEKFVPIMLEYDYAGTAITVFNIGFFLSNEENIM